jgi:hypothetical protein
MFIIVVTLIVDTSIIKTYDLISKKESLGWKIPIFGLIVVICAVVQYSMLEFVKRKRVKVIITPKELSLNATHKTVTTFQYILISLLVLVLIQIFVESYYSSAMLIAITSISYLLAIAMMIFLAQRFFSWYLSNKNSIILLYGLSAAVLATNAGFTLLLTIDKFVTFPTDILPRISGSALTPLSSWAIGLNYGYFVSSVVSFLITWTATSLLLRHYTHKLGNVKYWIILAIPLGYFLSQFVILVLNTFGPFIQADPVTISIFVTLLFMLSKPIGGILFGIAFWIMSRSISSENVVRNYLTISACGLVILFTSNQAIVLLTAPYPPFGLATVSFVGLSSYFILVGIYSSAISVSLDIGLRKSIRKSVEDHSKFLHGIGRAQMDQGIQEVVLKVSKEYSGKMVEQIGVEPSVTEEDLKQYVSEVIDEIKSDKNRNLT